MRVESWMNSDERTPDQKRRDQLGTRLSNMKTDPPIKFSIEHPYIQGTKLEREARAALVAKR